MGYGLIAWELPGLCYIGMMKKTLTRDEACAQLWRLAQAQTVIDAKDTGHELVLDAFSETVIPTDKALFQVRQENSELVGLADQK